MSMVFHSTVIALAFLQVSSAAPQTLDAITDADTYAIYVTLVRPIWEKAPVTTRPSLLQRETETPRTCAGFIDGMTGEWAEVASSFRRENARVRLLQPVLPIELPYRLVPREEILADDARVAVKYPDRSNAPPPGSLQYVAVSAVGFNAARTKALVYMRSRMSEFRDALLMKELKDGKWVTGRHACGAIA